MEQRSLEWYQDRLGRFTASEIHRLLGNLGTQKGKGAFDSYCMEKAIESVYGIIEDEHVSFDMQRGIDNEPYAFDKFKEIQSLSFTTVKKAEFIHYGLHAGSSPDGIVHIKDDLEIKCPNAKNFFKLALTQEVPDNHYDQMQMQLLCLGGSKAYYFNYCVHLGNEYHFTIEVPRDEVRIALIKERIDLAIVKKMEYVSQLQTAFLAHHDNEINATIVENLNK